MLSNEFIFLCHAIFASFGTVIAFFLSQQALIAIICTYSILANIFITKQIILVGYYVTATDAFTVGTVLGLNLINEFYGKKEALTSLYGIFFANVALAIFSWLHLIYTPASVDIHHVHFQNILNSTPRIIIASLIAYAISQYIETQLYAWLKQKIQGAMFIVRNCLTIPLTQLIDTILFSIIGLYGTVHNIVHIISLSYFIKILAILVCIPALYIIKILPNVKLKQNQRLCFLNFIDLIII